MSGIVVGIDGSHNATHALEWAMTEASIRQAPVTVITVNSVPANYWTGAPVELPGDQDRVAEIRKTARGGSRRNRCQARRRSARVRDRHGG
ncbi:MAG TPA: universal stress protein [Streptosporangiaceae bacterium]